jgi:hypothetical protein
MSRRRRRSPIETAESFFDPFHLVPDHLRPPPPTDDELRSWTYKQCLEWAANRSGIMQRDRLKRLKRARRYHDKWVDHLDGRHVDSVLDDANAWRDRQRVD